VFKRLGVLVLLLGTLLSPTHLRADEQLWTALAATGTIGDSEKLLFWFDAHARFEDMGDVLDVTIVRPGLGWRVNDRLSVWGGYARVTGRRAGPDVKEDRAWQQATYSIGELWGGKLSGRTRLEQRFRNDDGDDTGWRVRQTVRWTHPVGESDFDVVVASELFLGLNNADWGQRSGFDQNRAFFGGAWRVNPTLRIEAGYLNQRINRRSASDATNHNVSIAASTRF